MFAMVEKFLLEGFMIPELVLQPRPLRKESGWVYPNQELMT